MKIAIGPRGRQTMFSLIFGYRAPGRRWGKINNANGFTLRAGSVALHIWKPRGHALTQS
jgi:hypothetical protein